MILIIDNYDSFVHNIARYFAILGAEPCVVRNDRLTLDQIRRLAPRAIVISPGPGTPQEAGISLDVVRHLSGLVPILGICLGHQCIGAAFGGVIARAKQPMHGQSSDISHGGTRLFAGLPTPLAVGRYHSLIVEPTGAMDDALIVEARTPDREIMALSHREHETHGIQFHPESILTESGALILQNFLARVAERVPHALV